MSPQCADRTLTLNLKSRRRIETVNGHATILLILIKQAMIHFSIT